MKKRFTEEQIIAVLKEAEAGAKAATAAQFGWPSPHTSLPTLDNLGEVGENAAQPKGLDPIFLELDSRRPGFRRVFGRKWPKRSGVVQISALS